MASFDIIETLDALPEPLQGAAIAIGNFDGCHRGHQTVFSNAITDAKQAGSKSILLTFEPHPQDLFAPEPKMFRITPPPVKAKLAKAMGFDAIILAPFDKKFASLAPADFVQDYLVEKLKIRHACVGADFHFGAKRAGTPEYLSASGALHGFTTNVQQMIIEAEEPISSSRVRARLGLGEVESAAKLLGYHWLLTGEVIHGEKRGRELGFPTANMRLDKNNHLRHGIYAVRMKVDGTIYDGAASYGHRPTFDNGAALLETFLFDFDGDLYGKNVEVMFFAHLRDEEKFSDIDALKIQIEADCQIARELLAKAKPYSDIDTQLGFFPLA